ncbi:hypothetical protein DFJ58DRAFT_736003 [Suillus subalutaceus]|uniref:uncharacterized protein n=1 Tax=Suillus subalutaceus TaxID=48586 RepID=UPI001B866F3F|nr:uncharacterized protein DFJ58DRAFT_736003 [Suillus subalutaceus]KAG1833675.1 hypothetical protein DFJ58DRAFT_736003 [Suillus subalutaceus]
MAGKRKTIVPDLDDLRRSKRSNMGQGGRLTQLQKLESSQMNRQRPVKKKPRSGDDRQPTSNVMAASRLKVWLCPTSTCDPPNAISSVALSRFNSTPSGSSQPNTPNAPHWRPFAKHDNLRHHSKSDTSHALPASKPVPLEHTPAGAHSQKRNDPRPHCNASRKPPVSKHSPSTPPSPVTAIRPLTWNPNYTRPSRMNISDAEAPLHGDEGYDSGQITMWMLTILIWTTRMLELMMCRGNHGNDDQDDVTVLLTTPTRIMTPRKIATMMNSLVHAHESPTAHTMPEMSSKTIAQRTVAPRMPDLDELETLRRRATTQDSAQSSSEEENIRFYPPSWKDLLEATKKKSRLGLLTSTASKRSDFLKTKGIEYLLETLEDFGSQGGRTNNLANEALGSFYLFADAVPEGAVALAATALAAAIDEYKTGTYKQMKFVADLYQPIYDSVIQLYHDVQKDHYHAKKCRAARKKWARTAGILTRNDPNRRHDWGLKLQLD